MAICVIHKISRKWIPSKSKQHHNIVCSQTCPRTQKSILRNIRKKKMVCICEHSLVYQQIECDFVGTFNTQHLNSQFHACEFNFVVVVVVDVAVFVDFFVLLYSFHSSYCFIRFSCAFSCVGKIPIAFVEAQNTFHSNYHFRFDQRKIVSIEIAHHREKFSKNSVKIGRPWMKWIRRWLFY